MALLCLSNKVLWAKQPLFGYFLLNSLPVNTTFGHWFEYWKELNNQTLRQTLSSVFPRLEASWMPVLRPAPAYPTVTLCGCGCTPAPPAGAGQHSQGHLHCSTHLTFLATQLSPPLYFTCSCFPAALCLFIIFPCHTGLLQAFSLWQSLGLLLLWWDSPAAVIPGGGTCLLEWDVPHPRSVLCSMVWLLPQVYRQLSRGSASCSEVVCLGCYRLVTEVWGLAGNGRAGQFTSTPTFWYQILQNH